MAEVSRKLGVIAFVPDDRLSREKKQMLNRILNAIRQGAAVETFDASISENELLKKMEETEYRLVLVPWYKYLIWSRIEAFYGLTRTSGPTLAGYFADPILPIEPNEPHSYLRAILLDFLNLSASEIITVIATLVQENLRAGIRPWLGKEGVVYYENWHAGHRLGGTLDTVLALPEITAFQDWQKRLSTLRVTLGALWSLIFEEGPGKGEWVQALASKTPKAYFQIGISSKCLALRLCYPAKIYTPKNALTSFWPSRWQPTSAAQLLIKYADFLRIHRVVDTRELEVTALFFPSAPSECAPQSLHTLWIEPITNNLIQEPFYETQSQEKPWLKALPNNPTKTLKLSQDRSSHLLAKERFIRGAFLKIRDLKQQLSDKESRIVELCAGGVGSAPPPPLPDADALLDAFQNRCFEMDHEIENFRSEIERLKLKGALKHETEWMRKKIENLEQKKQEWIQKCVHIIKKIGPTRGAA
jgi:hypothetical protein